MISKNKSSKAERKYAHVSANRSTAALRGTFWSAVSSNAPTILGALVFIITSRYLSPRDFGVVALASSVISMASAIAPVAFGEALIQQQNINNRHLNSVFWICIISAIIIYLSLIHI